MRGRKKAGVRSTENIKRFLDRLTSDPERFFMSRKAGEDVGKPDVKALSEAVRILKDIEEMERMRTPPEA